MTAFASDTLPPDAPADIRYLLARLDAVTRERDAAVKHADTYLEELKAMTPEDYERRLSNLQEQVIQLKRQLLQRRSDHADE